VKQSEDIGALVDATIAELRLVDIQSLFRKAFHWESGDTGFAIAEKEYRRWNQERRRCYPDTVITFCNHILNRTAPKEDEQQVN
jgi:hypothetical protein